MAHFSPKTFRYFKGASENPESREWFEENKSLYKEHVWEPFASLIEKVDARFGRELFDIPLTPKKITRPLRPKNKIKTHGLVKDYTSASLSEKRTSLFEWNPSLYFHFGNHADDNFFGVGLWMVSSRQMKLMRYRLREDHEFISRMFRKKKFQETFGGFAGEIYTRFPKDFDPDDPKNEFLWHKRFFLHGPLLKKEVKSKDLAKRVIKDLELAMPYFIWLRETVGKYRKSVKAKKDWWQ